MTSDVNSTYPSFRGDSGTECEDFISSVRKAAFNVGKAEDDGWQASYASACLSGGALRFYETLPEATQASWRLLRTALLSKYPTALESPSSSAVPDAPAAAMPTVGYNVPGVPQQNQQNALGTLKVVVRWDYEPAELGDLTLKVGDVIDWVCTKHEGVPDGWWLGKNERTGLWGTFPSNWVYIVQETPVL